MSPYVPTISLSKLHILPAIYSNTKSTERSNMVRSTQFPRDATASERKKLWNPSETLGIVNLDHSGDITCFGYAPSKGRRCQNPINKANRSFIEDTLDEIAYLRPDSSAVMSRLRTIAGPALCVRYHQNQADTVLIQWQRKLQQLKPQIGERRPARSMQSNKIQQFTQEPSMQDLKEQLWEMRELLARLQEDANSQRYQDSGYERREGQVAKDRQEEELKRRRSEEREREARREAKERLERERLEKERLEKERLERERVERERLEKERREREEQKQREREREQAAADEERTRQREQKKREERERERREKEQKEREEWDRLWATYQERWVSFRASASTETNIRDAIPWPVKSGSYRDVKASNVRQFFQKAAPADANMATLMRKECLKWHPDKINGLLRDFKLTLVEKMMVDTICGVITDSLNSCAGRSSNFLG